jgi:DnaJ-class molecular chaperone
MSRIPCPSCHGHGRVYCRGQDRGPCASCRSTGRVVVSEVVCNGVPASLMDDIQRIVLRSLTVPLGKSL